jgi:hypothetical protein
MSGEWTYLVGLCILGAIVFTAGWIAANKERAQARHQGQSKPHGTDSAARCVG